MKLMEAINVVHKHGYRVVKKNNVNENFMSFTGIAHREAEKIMRRVFNKFIDNERSIHDLFDKYADEIADIIVNKYPKTQEEFDKVFTDLAYKILEEAGFDIDNEPIDLDKIEEAKRIVRANGLRFVKESKKYAGRHPVFDSKKFQDYLLKECGTGCDDCECDGVDSRECCDDQEVNICPDCGGEGCEHCNFKGYIEWEGDPNNMSDNDVYNDIDDYDIENDDSSFSYGPENADEFIDDMAMQNFNSFQKGRRPRY